MQMDQDNGWTQDIAEPGVIHALLDPLDTLFVVAEDEPLRVIVNGNMKHLRALIDAGATTVHYLAAVTAVQHQAIVDASGESAGVVDQWVSVAQQYTQPNGGN